MNKVTNSSETTPKSDNKTKLLGIAILVIVLVVASAGIGLYMLRGPDGEEPSPTPLPEPSIPPDYRLYSNYGFSFYYPSGSDITELGVEDATADDNSGLVLVETGSTPSEEILVSWFTLSYVPSRQQLAEAMEAPGFEAGDMGEVLPVGDLVYSTMAGHDLIIQEGYQPFLSKPIGQGVWYCDVDEIVYLYFYWQFDESTLMSTYVRHVTLFVCH